MRCRQDPEFGLQGLVAEGTLLCQKAAKDVPGIRRKHQVYWPHAGAVQAFALKP